MKREPTIGQLSYIRLLASLVGDRSRPPATFGAARSRIRYLKDCAAKQGIPSYRYEPAPVKTFFDESVKRSPEPAERLRALRRRDDEKHTHEEDS